MNSLFWVWLVVTGAIERSCYPQLFKTEGYYERDYQETLPSRRPQSSVGGFGQGPVTAVAIGSGSAALVG